MLFLRVVDSYKSWIPIISETLHFPFPSTFWTASDLSSRRYAWIIYHEHHYTQLHFNTCSIHSRRINTGDGELNGCSAESFGQDWNGMGWKMHDVTVVAVEHKMNLVTLSWSLPLQLNNQLLCLEYAALTLMQKTSQLEMKFVFEEYQLAYSMI